MSQPSECSPLAPTDIFACLLNPHSYVGDVYALTSDHALVQVHDFHRQQVGGIPPLCLLVATRLTNPTTADHSHPDSMLLVLRVIESVSLPGHDDAERVRVEVAQRVTGNPRVHWDDSSLMDTTTHHVLSFSGIRCAILGACSIILDDDDQPIIQMQTDFAPFVVNRGLKVYKPEGHALSLLINTVDPHRVNHQAAQYRVAIGTVRYTTTQQPCPTPVYFSPVDLLAQKTALFGMTRSEKSNTTKILMQAVFRLRFTPSQLRIGQLIFDANGEYANDNWQDAHHHQPSSLRHVWRIHPDGQARDVVVYGLGSATHDQHRRTLLINFLDSDSLALGKSLFDSEFATESAKFIQHFRHVRFEPPSDADRLSSQRTTRDAFFRARTRYERHVLVYRALLIQAGFRPPHDLRPNTQGLFNSALLDILAADERDHTARYRSAATIFRQSQPTWEQIAHAFHALADFMADRTSGYADFEAFYMAQHQSSGEAWADEPLKQLLTMFRYPNGVRQLARLLPYHSAGIQTDYARDIVNNLEAGRLVIVDHTGGDSLVAMATTQRIMQTLFSTQQAHFRAGVSPLPDMLVYLEEAHTLLPLGSDNDLKNIWVRTAKEGAKYHIGMVYATQEVSSIQRNILKNTTNWFIGHLNNTDEIRELSKYEDFADFAESIRRIPDRGFLRMRTISQRLTIPVQIDRFTLEVDDAV